MGELYQCTPNFSEGRRRAVVEAIVAAAQAAADVRVLDWSMDSDHNRSVITLIGDGESVFAAAVNAAEEALKKIDLRTHIGLHPRTGALDVLPFTPLAGTDRHKAVELAWRTGKEIADRFKIPVYYYEWAVRREYPVTLPQWRHALLHDELSADDGPQKAHPSGGVLLAGARSALVACNMYLNSREMQVAELICKSIRRERTHMKILEGVRALALFLPSRGRAQVSMNLTQPDKNSLPLLFEFVDDIAKMHGLRVEETEIIGVLPAGLLAGASPGKILWHKWKPEQILEPV